LSPKFTTSSLQLSITFLYLRFCSSHINTTLNRLCGDLKEHNFSFEESGNYKLADE